MLPTWAIGKLNEKTGLFQLNNPSYPKLNEESIADDIVSWLKDNGAIRVEKSDHVIEFQCKSIRLALGPNPLNSFEYGLITIIPHKNGIRIRYRLKISRFDLLFIITWTIGSTLFVLEWIANRGTTFGNSIALLLLPASGLFMLDWIYHHASGLFKRSLKQTCLREQK